MTDTIFALSSGPPPAAIAVIRVTGFHAEAAMVALTGRSLAARRAVSATLRDADGGTLDRVLALWLPGPATATGEDTLELHCHGGRAVVAAVERALAATPGLRAAQPGEFTRRAFANGKIDLAEAEGLADLLSAETELQRSAAIAMAGGALSREVEDWRGRVLALSAAVEAVLDFADEDDVAVLPDSFADRVTDLQAELTHWLSRPRAEALREGFRVVLAGPPNAGKSTLFNVLVDQDAAIVTPMAGTTRDLLTHPVSLGGVPFRFVDTAGLRGETSDAIEAIGIERARQIMVQADLVLWLGPEGKGPAQAWEIESQIDRSTYATKPSARHRISAVTGEGMDALLDDLVTTARAAMPKPGEAALSRRQHDLVTAAAIALGETKGQRNPLLIAESLRAARVAFDRLVGKATTEDMLDTLFARFCIGK